MSQYSSALKKTADGEKWLAFLPRYLAGPVAV